MRPIANAALSPSRREALVADLHGSTFDAVVIGGGVTGVATALDLITRGRTVLVVEQGDLASGTSSRSSKLIHGGLRYLEQMDAGLVREALRERGLLTSTLCPHLVRPQHFLYPLKHRVWERAYVGAGIGLYDVLAKLGGDRLDWHRHYTVSGALQRFPSLRPDGLAGAIQYSDAQLDDARHTMMVARTAAAFGAEILTSARVERITGAEEGQVNGVDLVDRETGRPAHVNAGVVVNACGVWTERTEALAGRQGLSVRASKGIHLVVPGSAISGQGALITRAGPSVLFVLPWGDDWILGTTDTDWSGSLARPSVSGQDVDYVLGHANQVLDTNLTRNDVMSSFVGLRPLISGVEASTAKLSREHATVAPVPGLVSIAGGKYTTYRVMGQDAADAAEQQLGSSTDGSTDRIPLLGAAGFEQLAADPGPVMDGLGVDETAAHRLLGRYGSAVHELIETTQLAPVLAEPLPGGQGYLGAEVAYAVTHEGARHLDDVLRRRTRLAFESADRGVAAAEAAAAIVGPLLGWEAARTELEVGNYRDNVAAEQAGELATDDQGAERLRTDVADIRSLVAG